MSNVVLGSRAGGDSPSNNSEGCRRASLGRLRAALLVCGLALGCSSGQHHDPDGTAGSSVGGSAAGSAGSGGSPGGGTTAGATPGGSPTMGGGPTTGGSAGASGSGGLGGLGGTAQGGAG